MSRRHAHAASRGTPVACLRRWAGRSLPLAAALLMVACATPTERITARAADLGFDELRLQGEGFRHVAFAAGLPSSSRTLHVYVEHDGTPWLAGSRVSPDPTPRTPVALQLMAKDAGPRLWVGRPCYLVPTTEPGCDPLVWTHRRYAPEVVRSMVAAVRGFVAAHALRDVVLIGHSGGGTLAWLMAGEMPETTAVVTIAANLDTDAWARIHGYSALAGSQNPALMPALPPAIAQRHYVGGRDTNVPPSVVEGFAARHRDARIVVIADYDHECCWVSRWPQLLDAVLDDRGNPARSAN